MLKTQIAIDSQASCTNKFQYHYFGPNDSIYDTMYEAFESGEPVIIDGHTVEGIDMDYYANLPEWYTDKNACFSGCRYKHSHPCIFWYPHFTIWL